MSIVLLNVVVIWIILAIAIGFTLVAGIMITVSLVRHFNKKKKGVKTNLIGLWVGTAMLVIPWIVFIVIVINIKIEYKEKNYVDGSKVRNEVAEAFLDKDAEKVYDLFAPNVIEECGLTVDDIQKYMDSINIEDRDIERYTSSMGADNSEYRTFDYLIKGGGNNRPKSETQGYADFFMQKINSNGETIYFAMQTSDKQDKGNVGIHYIVLVKDADNEERLGRSETWAYYPTDEVQEEIDKLKDD